MDSFELFIVFHFFFLASSGTNDGFCLASLKALFYERFYHLFVKEAFYFIFKIILLCLSQFWLLRNGALFDFLLFLYDESSC